MKKQFIVTILLMATALGVQAQGTPGSRPKGAGSGSASGTVVIDSAANASATNDGASGQSGRPMAVPASTTAQGTSSVKSQKRTSQKVKRSSRNN